VSARTPSRAGLLLALIVALTGCPRPPAPGEPLRNLSEDERARFQSGRSVFERVFAPETGLGPLFNAPSCATCHLDPASGGNGEISEIHATILRADGFCDPLAGQGGPVFQEQVTAALRDALGIDREPIPPEAARARRTTPDVFGFGFLDAVPDSTILALADPDDADGDGISGRVNRFFDGRVGRFGRKALVPTLAEFNEGAFQIEQGVTTPNVLDEGTIGGQPIPEGVDPVPEPEIDAESVGLADAFVRFLAPPAPLRLKRAARRGRGFFSEIGCTGCHVPKLRTGDHPVKALANREIAAYTDLLLHDMGPQLADVCLGLVARPEEFRTEPLMGLRLAKRFLHDGRATTIEEAVRLHGGEAAKSRDAFAALSEKDRAAVLAFLGSL
ncbi:MAG: di-heme oxidoredictase family protein, partial [Gemmatimonadota bacterium]